MNFIELKNKFNLNDNQIEQLNKYADFLVEYNQKINLTAITNKEDIIEKHFYDSLLPSKFKELKGTLVDVGTGAGFPGVVLKILKPELKVILLEPINKRCIFLNELIKLLELKDIEVINIRGEDYSLKHREEYDFVTARAVTNLPALIEICGAMVKVNGYFIALRGLDGINEIESSKYAFKQLGFKDIELHEEYLSDNSKRVIAYINKETKSSKSFPRKYSIIKNNPLCQK